MKCTWEVFEESFSNKWTKDAKMDVMHRIQDELKEPK
jgi:5-methylthioribose kinase